MRIFGNLILVLFLTGFLAYGCGGGDDYNYNERSGSSSVSRSGGHNLTGSGGFMNQRASISGNYSFRETSPMGDGYVRFNGVIKSGMGNMPIEFEGSTSSEYYGGIQTPRGLMLIKVIFGSGQHNWPMNIYQAEERMGASPMVAQFRCNVR